MVDLKDDCQKCHGKRQVTGKDGTISICFDCLAAGRLDQHDKKVKSQSELGVKIY